MHVLFATDGSGPAKAAGRVMEALFDPLKVSIDVLSVAAPPNLDPLAPDLSAEWERLDLPVLDAEHVAGEASDRLTAHGFTTVGLYRRGETANEIVHAVQRQEYGLVVMGGSHTTWLGNALLGSVSTTVLHHAPTSVLIAHRAPSDSAHVLIGVDGSAASSLAVGTAMTILDESRCSLEIASVVQPLLVSALAQPIGVPYPGAQLVAEMDQEVETRARHTAAREAVRARAGGFRAESLLLVGPAAPQLLKEAENTSADLVVVGSRGLSTVGRTFLGSVSDPIVRHAPATLVARKKSSPWK